MSAFRDIREAPPIEVFMLSEQCNQDADSHKINLTVGAYRSNEGKPWVLPCVRTAEMIMARDETLTKEYLPITGLDDMCKSALRLLLGSDNELLTSQKIDCCQALGGTGAIFLALNFLSKVLNCKTVYISDPTWPNHIGISRFVGLTINKYRYWDAKNKNVDFEGMVTDLTSASESSVVILHACAHNPTGIDLTRDQWKEIANIVQKRKLIPVFDIAYQGFASGDLDADAWAVRYFASIRIEMFVAQSFSKNFGLYNERVGNLIVFSSDPEATIHVKSQLKILIRQSWSNPPQHGARIVSTILNDPSLSEEWKSNVIAMATRIKSMRQMLYERLVDRKTPGSWEHIVKQIGMFSYTGLTKPQAEYIRSQHHIYIMNDGRVNMCGLTTHNIDYIADAIHDTVTKVNE